LKSIWAEAPVVEQRGRERQGEGEREREKRREWEKRDVEEIMTKDCGRWTLVSGI
jgi:hypothetical protein